MRERPGRGSAGTRRRTARGWRRRTGVSCGVLALALGATTAEAHYNHPGPVGVPPVPPGIGLTEPPAPVPGTTSPAPGTPTAPSPVVVPRPAPAGQSGPPRFKRGEPGRVVEDSVVLQGKKLRFALTCRARGMLMVIREGRALGRGSFAGCGDGRAVVNVRISARLARVIRGQARPVVNVEIARPGRGATRFASRHVVHVPAVRSSALTTNYFGGICVGGSRQIALSLLILQNSLGVDDTAYIRFWSYEPNVGSAPHPVGWLGPRLIPALDSNWIGGTVPPTVIYDVAPNHWIAVGVEIWSAQHGANTDFKWMTFGPDGVTNGAHVSGEYYCLVT